MLKVSPVVHVIRTMERTRAGRPREIELQYGGARAPGQMPSACANEGSSPGWGTSAHAVDHAQQDVA